MSKIRSARGLERVKEVSNLEYFPAEDTKQYLLNLLKNKSEDLSVKAVAARVLKMIINKEDTFLVPELLEILKVERRSLPIILYIIGVFDVLKDPMTLGALNEIAFHEKDYPFYPIKTEAQKVLNEIVTESGAYP